MKLYAYTLYDNKALIYSPPFFALNADVAKRNVADTVSDPNTTLGRHPADYVLYCIGEFDDHNGFLNNYDPRQHVADVRSLVPPATPTLPFDMKGMSDMFKPNGSAPDTLSAAVIGAHGKTVKAAAKSRRR